MRIATHAAVRSRGLGSRLLAAVRREFADEVDWLGVGYGATPELLSFWAANGYSTVHVSTTRNESSGEYSALMVDPTSEAGGTLHDRHADWFADRFRGQLADALRDLDPDVVRAVLRGTDGEPPLDLTAEDWRLVASTAFGPGLYSVDPEPFRQLAVRALADGGLLSPRQERLLVLVVLQGRPWGQAADRLEFHSRRECMRALGGAYRPLVDAYGTDAALAEKRRFE